MPTRTSASRPSGRTTGCSTGRPRRLTPRDRNGRGGPGAGIAGPRPYHKATVCYLVSPLCPARAHESHAERGEACHETGDAEDKRDGRQSAAVVVVVRRRGGRGLRGLALL